MTKLINLEKLKEDCKSKSEKDFAQGKSFGRVWQPRYNHNKEIDIKRSSWKETFTRGGLCTTFVGHMQCILEALACKNPEVTLNEILKEVEIRHRNLAIKCFKYYNND